MRCRYYLWPVADMHVVLNSAVNVVIYVLFYKRFRHVLAQVVCCCSVTEVDERRPKSTVKSPRDGKVPREWCGINPHLRPVLRGELLFVRNMNSGSPHVFMIRIISNIIDCMIHCMKRVTSYTIFFNEDIDFYGSMRLVSIKNWNCDILKHTWYYFDVNGLTETRVVYAPVKYVTEAWEIILFANLKLLVFLYTINSEH